jgi:hypothetical protein
MPRWFPCSRSDRDASGPGPRRDGSDNGGIALVERATGISRSTIQRGFRELESGETLASERTRRAGGGRRRVTADDTTLPADLDALVEPTAPGDLESPLRWTSKSVRTLAVALAALGHRVTRGSPVQLPGARRRSVRSIGSHHQRRQHA